MMSQAYRKSISVIIIQLYSKIYVPHGKCSKTQNACGARNSIHLQHLLSHNSLAECFTKKKNKQHFHDHHDHAAYDCSREYMYKRRLSITTIRMAYM